MNSHTLLYEIEEEWSSCEACSLSKNRTGSLSFGRGNQDAICLALTSTDYEGETGAVDILSKIWNRANVDTYDMYTAPITACPGNVTATSLEACRKRISEMTFSISPASIILMGKGAYISFFGKEPSSDEIGTPIACKNYKVFYTYCINDFLALQEKSPEKSSKMAKDILAHWSMIGKGLEHIKSSSDTTS
jgi:uracil-DNA glycosylase